jgi:mRNA interferase MazF
MVSGGPGRTEVSDLSGFLEDANFLSMQQSKSPSAVGRSGRAIFCPITNQVKGYPFEVLLPAGLKTTGVVLTDHVKSLDWRSRKADRHERVPESVVREVCDRVMTLFNIDDATSPRAET